MISHNEDVSADIPRVLERSPEPHLLIDATGRYRYLNPAAAAIIGPAHTVLGQASPFTTERSQEFHGRLRRTHLGWTAIEFTQIPFAQPDGEWNVIRFELVHEHSRRGRQLEAIVAIAGALSNIERLDDALAQLAREVRTTVDLESCAVTLLEPDSRVRIAGTSNLPDDYAQRMERCRELGAPLLTVRALAEDRVIVDPTWRQSVLSDERWRPLHDTVRRLHLGTLIAVPLRVRDAAAKDEIEGALTVFCREDVVLDYNDIAFLRAVTDYAAIAISNARMFGRLRMQAAREERLRLSRELHDSVTQELFSLSLRTRALARRADLAGANESAAELTDLHAQVQRAMAQMRALIVRGRAVEIGPGGVGDALRAQVSQLMLPAGIDVVVEVDDEPEGMDTALQEDVYLLAVEAVRNAVKHARATRIDVIVARDAVVPTTLRVSVTDDGVGFVPSRRSVSAVGLDAMLERARAHGGQFAVASTPGAGTTVTATFPGALAAASVAPHRAWESAS